MSDKVSIIEEMTNGVGGDELNHKYGARIKEILGSVTPIDLAFSFLRFETLRKLSATQLIEFANQYKQAKGDFPTLEFELLVDALVIRKMSLENNT